MSSALRTIKDASLQELRQLHLCPIIFKGLFKMVCSQTSSNVLLNLEMHMITYQFLAG